MSGLRRAKSVLLLLSLRSHQLIEIVSVYQTIVCDVCLQNRSKRFFVYANFVSDIGRMMHCMTKIPVQETLALSNTGSEPHNSSQPAKKAI